MMRVTLPGMRDGRRVVVFVSSQPARMARRRDALARTSRLPAPAPPSFLPWTEGWLPACTLMGQGDD